MNGKEITRIETSAENYGIRSFGFIDILVILLSLSTAAASIYLFRQDLMQTIDAFNEEPAGTIIIRNNIIQRRHEDRVLWDRIFVDSPVYNGDLIRAGELSSATIYIETNQINLNENSLIRIAGSSERQGNYHIELQEGNLSITIGSEGSDMTFNLMGREVQAAEGSVLNASVGDEGIIIQVSEGAATFTEEGQNSRAITEGMMIAQDERGVERIIPAVVVIRPLPNARYLKNSERFLPVDFNWRRINLEDRETLLLEIAEDRNFSKNSQVIEVTGSQMQTAFDAGIWHWRLSYQNIILSSGQITVIDSSGPVLLSPAMNSIYRYQNNMPQLRFQWTESQSASYYIIEIADEPDFRNPLISRQSSSAAFIQTAPGSGTWYWRVLPVFPSAYEGAAGYSHTASFRVEQSNDPQAQVLEVPEATVTANVNARTAPPVLTPPPITNTAASKTSAVYEITRTVNNRVNERYYTVQPGDTLSRIAIQIYGVASYYLIIAEANNLQNPDLIFVEQVLLIPPKRE